MEYNTLWKSTLREIKGSFGRFAAIMAIVALGVGLFSGLKVTRTAMARMVQEYWEETNFYDYRLISTLGFEQEDVDFLSDFADVKAAEGALSFDVLYRDEAGAEGVVKIYSLTNRVNDVTVLEGRMPRRPEECLVDSKLFGSDAIGQKLILSENNEQETVDHFAEREYTIVGRAQSPLYIQFERGNTSLGTGKINGFAYLMKTGFTEGYYTEIYVKFRENMPLYSDAYKDFLLEKDVVWEDLAAQAADNRFGRLKADAEAEYCDALEEFETKKADADAELADARQELEDAVTGIADGEQELKDAKKEIADGEQKLADARQELADGEQELADARQTIADKKAELADAERKISSARQEWNTQKEKVEAARKELDQKNEEFQKQEELFEQEKKRFQTGEEALQKAVKELTGNVRLTAVLMEAGIISAPMNNIEDICAAQDNLDRKLAKLQESVSVSGGDVGAAGQAMAQIVALGAIRGSMVIVTSTYEQLKEGQEALNAGEAQLQDGREQIAAGYQELENASSELDKAWQQIAAGDRQIAEGRKDLEDAEKELSDGEAKLEDARKEVEKGEKELSDARKEVASGEAELADARQKYADGLAEYEDGLAEFEEKIADGEAELADAREQIDSLEGPESFLLGRDTNIGYVCFESDSAIVDGIANVFPVFFFLVAALVCITTMNRMVEEQRTQIGVLKALGYGESAVMMKYIFYSGSAAILGCVIGFFGGTYIFPKVIWAAYCMMYSVGDIGYVFDWKLAVISLIVSVLCSVGTTWLSCRVELSQVAAQLMRPKAPKAGKRVFLERIPFLWKRLSFLRKVSVRNIFRYKKRMFMMILGISGCTALLVTGFGINDSIAGVADQQFGEIQIYDLSVILKKGFDAEMEEKLTQALGEKTENALVSGRISFAEKSMDIVTDATRKGVYVDVFEDGADVTPFLELHSVKGEPVAYPGRGEAVVTHKIAEDLGIGIGDRIVLENDDMRCVEAVVSGISKNFIYNYVYLSASTYADCLGEAPECKSLYIKAAPGADLHTISASLMGVEGVTNVTVNEDVLVRFNRMMESMNLIVVVVIICAALLAFVVLYNLTNINITERVREIATIKVLGFYKKETASYVFRENTVLTLFGALPGLLLGRWLHSFVMSQIKVDMVSFDVRILPQSYLYSLVFTFLFGWFVNRLMSRKLEKISMTESLKSVD